MEKKSVSKSTSNFGKFWTWLWESDSFWSYIVLLAIIFVVVKFIFLPGLGLIFGTSLPLAIVESSSMDHHALGTSGINTNSYEICGKNLEAGGFLSLDEYWSECGSWYEDKPEITKDEFSDFSFTNGFRKGDLMIIFGKNKEDIKLGDVIIFEAGRAHPIIHRVISLDPLMTKGDHNSDQLPEERGISESQTIGVAKARIPYVGWVKLFFVELWRGINP